MLLLTGATEQPFDILLVVWVVAIIATIIGELVTSDLSCIWFTGGAIVALILDICGVSNPFIQLGVFLVVSFVLLFTIGKICKNKINNNVTPTNIEAAIGKEIIITKAADHINHGEGKYAGLYWTVTCKENESVEKGDIAYILEVNGNKLLVSKNK